MPNNASEPRPDAQSVPSPVATGTAPRVAADGCAEAGRDARPTGRRDACPTVPDHELIRRIGRGSYGEVWLARNIMGGYRAVKIVYRESFDSDRPYEREFHGIRQFEPISRSHPSQVNILHVGKGDGCFFYVMELADQAEPKRSDGVAECWSDVGTPRSPLQRSNPTALRHSGTPVLHHSTTPSLQDPASYVPRTLKSEVARRGRLPAGESLEIGLALTTALEHLHQHGLVHRDVKPSNVIFVNGIPKLADIGLVTGADVTRSFVGTEGFIPPEGPGTPRADIYGLGKVLYEISTGKDRHNFPEPPTLLADLGDRQELLGLDEIIQKACASDTPQRYQSAAVMHEDLLLLKAGKSVKRVHGIERRLALLTRVSVTIGAVLVVVVPGYLFALHEKKQAVLAAGRATAAEQGQVRLSQEAETARRQAEMDKAKALNEAAKSQQVAKFLEDMLHGVGPAVAKGRDTTLLKEILDKTVERMGKDLAEQPEVELELRNTLAGVYEQLGLYTDLEELACENVQLARSRLGTESVALASALNRSALASLRAGHLSQAEQFALEALVMRRKLLGNENEDVAVTLQILGAVLSNAGRLSEAEAIDREGLALRLRLLGSEDPDVAVMWSNLSLVLLGQGKLQEAETCAREALAINRKHLGPAHPWLATSINNLGLVLKNEARFAEAEALYRESLAMDLTVNGTNHPALLHCFLNLASVLEAQGKFEEAETLQRQGLDLAPKLSGRADGVLAASFDSLGSMVQRRGKLAEAEALYQIGRASCRERG